MLEILLDINMIIQENKNNKENNKENKEINKNKELI